MIAQQNPTLDRVAARQNRAGSSSFDPVLTGFKSRLRFAVHQNEVLVDARVRLASGATVAVLSPSLVGSAYEVDITHGTHTQGGAAPTRNIIEWTTTLGVSKAQIWVVNPPTSGGVWIAGQEAQDGEAIVYANQADTDPNARDVSLAVNVLPVLADEFFRGAEYEGNRFANTFRSWGGAETVEAFLDGSSSPIVDEMPVRDFWGWYWNEPSQGLHTVRLDLRSKSGSLTFVSLTAKVRVRQIPCS